MTWREWRSLFQFKGQIDPPHLSITCMCPYAFLRLLWYHNTKAFAAWPAEWETGVVVGWRRPWGQFHEKAWIRREPLPLALYGAMDQAYVARATRELGWGDAAAENPYAYSQHSPYIAATIREMQKNWPPLCGHKYWIANCQDCARAALTFAVFLTASFRPKAIPDPRESPIDAFRRREAEAKRLAANVRDAALPEVVE